MGNTYRIIAAVAAAAALAVAVWAFVELAEMTPIPNRTDVITVVGDADVSAAGEETRESETAEVGDVEPSMDLLEVALDVATRPDSGPSGQVARWTGDTVTVYIAPDGWENGMRGHVYGALDWVTATTGMEIRHVPETEAQIVITPRSRSGGRVSAVADGFELRHADIEIGGARARVAYEEIGQAMGAFGDWGPEGSIFSQDLSAQYPSSFDSWVLESIYRVEAGASRSDLRVILKASLP